MHCFVDWIFSYVQVLTTDGQVTLEMVMAQVSIAFQRALIAFPLRYKIEGKVDLLDTGNSCLISPLLRALARDLEENRYLD